MGSHSACIRNARWSANRRTLSSRAKIAQILRFLEQIAINKRPVNFPIEKAMDVLWLAFRRTDRMLDAGGQEANALRRALSSIFPDGKDQRALEHLLTQTIFLLNSWSVEKPCCVGCSEKALSQAEYGYDDGVESGRIFRNGK